MSLRQEPKRFIGYEYKEVDVEKEYASFFIDSYGNFGWIVDDNIAGTDRAGRMTIRLKRDMKIGNKQELTRLQQHFEACVQDIRGLEQAKTTAALIWALSVGVLGTVCMAGSTFAVVHEPPVIWLCVLLAIPGFIGWIAPYFLYRHKAEEKRKALQPLIEKKFEEIYTICEKGHSLL